MARLVITYDPVERFVVGTVGEPGDRSFFLQARHGKRLTSVLLEKAQVVAIVERLDLLLHELRRVEPNLVITSLPRDDEPLEQPIVEEFRVGLISLAWLSDRELVSIDLQATSEQEENDENLVIEDFESAPDLLHVILTAAQTEAFIKRATSVINAGRPPCPFCGLPLDPRGHVCPRANGYRR
ncbi:MAG: DUF3090 family protein [Candidatus Nanopelagicaceae bacterium]|nr:DUF3090 family protein [Candidatus Nanopelagicaceae bacterium]